MKNQLIALCAVGAAFGLSAQSPIVIESKDKDSSMKLGFLLQPTFETLGSPTLEGTSQNLYLKRVCVALAGSFGKDFEYFIQFANPNLGRSSGAETFGGKNRNSDGMIIQDASLTYKVTDKLKIDAGYLLIPYSRAAITSSASQLSWDYSAYTFLQNGPMGTNIGRDAGVQVRGVTGKKQGNLEFYAGVWQGKRAPANETTMSNNSLRYAGRVQWNFFDSEGGYFLSTTYMGAKKVLSVAVGHDRQDDYSATAFDFFMDMPIGSNVVTAQWNRILWDGGDWLTTIPKQTTDMVEVGYLFGAKKLTPVVRYEARKMDTPNPNSPSACDESRMGTGLVWWLNGHKNNLRAFYTKVSPKNSDTLKSYDQFNIQWQVFFW